MDMTQLLTKILRYGRAVITGFTNKFGSEKSAAKDARYKSGTSEPFWFLESSTILPAAPLDAALPTRLGVQPNRERAEAPRQ